jgi:hypothetical protein
MMSFPGASEEQLILMATELKGLKLVITALRMPTWEFPFKVNESTTTITEERN